MSRKTKPEPKTGDVRLTLLVPAELIKRVKERAQELAQPGTNLTRSDAVRVAMHHFVDERKV